MFFSSTNERIGRAIPVTLHYYLVGVGSLVYNIRHFLKKMSMRQKKFYLSVPAFSSFEIQCPPKVWRQSYKNCSILCYYNIYISVKIKQNNDVNYFYIMLNCT